METCKEILDEATKKGDYKGKLQLFTKLEKGGTKATGSHTVELISSRAVTGTDYNTKKDRPEVEITVKEEGILKTYNFPVKDKKGGVHYLVERFAEIKAGTMVILEGKKSGVNSYVDVNIADGQEDVGETRKEDIPIITEEESTEL